MPQGPAHLHQLFGSDGVAWSYLKRRGFILDPELNGVILPPWRKHLITPMEEKAIDYLWMEWDWAYAPTRAPESPPEGSRLLRYRRWLSRVSSGPLRVTERHLWDLQMWWVCVARYEIRRRWYYLTGRRKEWDEGEEF